MRKFNTEEAVEITKDLFSKIDTNSDFEVSKGFSKLERDLNTIFYGKKSIAHFLSTEGEGHITIMTIMAYNSFDESWDDDDKESFLKILLKKIR